MVRLYVNIDGLIVGFSIRGIFATVYVECYV